MRKVFNQTVADCMESVDKLDSAQQGELFIFLKVITDACLQMGRVEGDVNEYVEHWYATLRDGDQT